MTEANFLTGSSGLIAVDKIGNHVLFLDPVTYDTELTLEGFAPRVHELLISPDRRLAAADLAAPPASWDVTAPAGLDTC